MSSSDKDLNIPNLGPAQRDPDVAAQQPTARVKPEPAAPSAPRPSATVSPATAPRAGGFGIFTGGLLLLVLAACGGLGYWVMELQQQFQARTVELTEARYQLGELQELLKSAEDSALESGKSLITQVAELNKAAQQKYRAYDSELARLKTSVEQRNRLEIEAQKKALAAQKAELSELETLAQAQKTLLDQQAAAMNAQNRRIEVAEKQLTAMAKQGENVEKAVKFVTALKISQDKLSTDQRSKGKALDDAVAALKRDLATTRTEISTLTEIFNEQLAEQSEAISGVKAGLGKATAGDPGLQRRVAINEDAIRAFDGTRRQLNRELLQIRQKLNNLQLKIETR